MKKESTVNMARSRILLRKEEEQRMCKDCAEFDACQCGCGYGRCDNDGEWLRVENPAGDCEYFESWQDLEEK